jgi:hypothetical protein
MITVLRWLARALSILVGVMLLAFACGEGLNLSHFTARELLLFLFFPLGLCAGLAVAWWREGLGGGIAVASLAAFYLVDYWCSASFPRGFAFLVLAGPGFLFLGCGLWTHFTRKPKPEIIPSETGPANRR